MCRLKRCKSVPRLPTVADNNHRLSLEQPVMKWTTISASVLLAILLASGACSRGATVASGPNSFGTQAPQTSGDLHYKVPDGWVSAQPSSKMRVAQFKLPKAEGDNEDGELVLYYFGANQGGTAEANIDRWISQIQQAD